MRNHRTMMVDRAELPMSLQWRVEHENILDRKRDPLRVNSPKLTTKSQLAKADSILGLRRAASLLDSGPSH